MNTLKFYEDNAKTFAENTIHVDFSSNQDRFLSKLPAGGKILDFGCGSGRDTKCFLEREYDVHAIDGSLELCKLASEYTGIKVKHMLFQELDEDSTYDGIWACASILHLSKDELKEVFIRMRNALKPQGIIYTSFKYGVFEGMKDDRYFTYFTKESFESFFEDMEKLTIEESWINGDVRAGRSDERWLNVLIRKER